MTRQGVYSLLRWICGLVILGFGIWPLKAATASVLSANPQQNQPTPGDLIAAVNQLRVGRGLNALNVNPILMQTAQMQADALMYSSGAVGHTRPNGMSYTDQLISMGYPLAGDLSLGGYRAENIISAPPHMTVDEVINMWLGDELHTNTMLSPYYQDIGAGIAIDEDGTVYYVIDCAMPTASGTPQAYTPVSNSGGTGDEDGTIQYIQPLILATARPDGDVVHEVLYGHSLWSIAIAYGTKIDWIQRYNNIADTTIYTGQKLLVQKGATQPVPTATTTSTMRPGRSSTPNPSPSPTFTITATEEEKILGEEPNEPSVELEKTSPPWTSAIIGGIFLVSMLVGGLITWLGNRRGE